jgi:hypothetical protein
MSILFENRVQLGDIRHYPNLDGEFLQYSVSGNAPQKPSACILLRTLAAIVVPLMRRHLLRSKIDLPIVLEEFFPQNPNLLGIYQEENDPTTGAFDFSTIFLRLRSPHDWTTFMPLGEILCTLCHELAHSWYLNHSDLFYFKWKDLMQELNEDLEGMLIIDPGPGRDAEILQGLEYDSRLALRCLERFIYDGSRDITHIGDRKPMAAAQN